MAWVNRTTRDNCSGGFQHTGGLAATHLGPGCYETSPTRRVRPNAAGFGSCDKSERGAVAPVMITPGPGAYAHAAVAQTPWESPSKSRAAASAAFVSKSQRLAEVKTKKGDVTPGPGTYTKPDSFTGGKKKTRSSLGNLLVRDEPKSNKIKWTRLPTAPSIPTLSQSFGYEQGPYGKLVRHEPVTVGHTGRGVDTLGPGEYDPLRGLKSIHKPRATDFSKGKVTRIFEQEVKAKEAVPGPGQYEQDLSAGTTAAGGASPARASAVFKSSITRETAAGGGLSSNNKQPVPGPGAYYSSNQASGFAKEFKPENLQFFGSTSTRFDPPHQDTVVPGPGSYYYSPPIAAPVRSVHSASGRKKPGFSCRKERFEPIKAKDLPRVAPGSYEIPSALTEKLNKVTSRVQTFGSTTKRFDSLSGVSERAPETVESQLEREMRADSSNNQPDSAKKREQPPKFSSSFASNASRFQEPMFGPGPSPGDYEVVICRSWDAPGAQGAFKSVIDRMPKKEPKAPVPGPGAYSPAPVKQKPLHMARPDVFFGAEPRFKTTATKSPVLGPGHYNTETVESDWNRPTYNITIATEMELAMLQ